jgi:hypothetical protein
MVRHTSGEKRNTWLWWRNLKRSLGRPRRRGEDIVKMNKQNWTVWTGFIYGRVGIRGGF